MTELTFKTKSGGSPERKPRVYFTCHPADMERSLDKLCEDIFASSDCAVFYTEDMTARLPEETRETDLERMNLFVIPVSLKLLLEPSRAMDEDFPLAVEQHIPVLPIMMEPGLDDHYSRKFGELQYLDPNVIDPTAIPYAEKLKKYLNSTLFDSETVERIQNAFDAYIFLSYRKKDRKKANQLMRLIHADPKCRDIAIWFDEFLTPGESFTDTIRDAMERSKAFTLLVTPSLLELNDRGEPNYVRATEYPKAKALAAKREEQQEKLEFLPAELSAGMTTLTDRAALFRDFAGLPNPMNLNSEEERECFLARLRKLAAEEKKDDPTHNYLIGLAYLNGIDVEVDRERGLELITAAGEAGLPEAMEKLFSFFDGECGRHELIQFDGTVDYRKVVYWAEKRANYYSWLYGEESPHILDALRDLVYGYRKLGRVEYAENGFMITRNGMNKAFLRKAQKLQERVYSLTCKMSGEAHPDALNEADTLARCYYDIREPLKALELQKRVYRTLHEANGALHADTINFLDSIAQTYNYLKEYREAAEIWEKVYALKCRVAGEDHPSTKYTLRNLEECYETLKDFRKLRSLQERIFNRLVKAKGFQEMDTLRVATSLAFTCWELEDYTEAHMYWELSYQLSCNLLGEDNRDTLSLLINLAFNWGYLKNNARKQELLEKACGVLCEACGAEDPLTLRAQNSLAVVYEEVGNYLDALKLYKKIHSVLSAKLGPGNPITLQALRDVSASYGALGDNAKAQELEEKARTMERLVQKKKALDSEAASYRRQQDYATALPLEIKALELSRKTMGVEHPDTLEALNIIAYTYWKLGKQQEATEQWETLYSLQCKAFGEDHPNTLHTLKRLKEKYELMENYPKAMEQLERQYLTKCKSLGREHEASLEALYDLADYSFQQGNYVEALELLEELYPLYCKVLGEAHPDTTDGSEEFAAFNSGHGSCYVVGGKTQLEIDAKDILAELAFSYNELGKYNEALDSWKKLYELMVDELGETDPDTLYVMEQLATAYGDAGYLQEELEYSDKTYALRCKVLGEDDPDTLVSLHNLAWVLERKGDYQKSLEHWKRAYTLRCQVLGEFDPATLSSLSGWAEVLDTMGDRIQALDICDEIVRLNTALPKRAVERIAAVLEHAGRRNDAEKFRQHQKHKADALS